MATKAEIAKARKASQQSLIDKVSGGYGVGAEALDLSGIGEGLVSLGSAVVSKISEKRSSKEGLEKRAGRKEKRAERKIEKARGTATDTNRKLKRKHRLYEKSDKLKSQAEDLHQQAIKVDTISGSTLPTAEESPLLKKSAFKYNANLVNAVTRAYASEGDLVTPEALNSLTEPIFGTLKDLSKKSSEFAQQATVLNKSKGIDLSKLDDNITTNILEIQSQADQAIKSGKGLFGNKAESLKEIASYEEAIQTLKETDDKIKELQVHVLENNSKRSNSMNVENGMLWDNIASGNIWGMMQYDGKGGYHIINPMGAGTINILELDFMPTLDDDYPKLRGQAIDNMLRLHKSSLRGDYPKEELENQARAIAIGLNSIDGDNKFDDDDFDEFVKSVWSGDVSDITGEMEYGDLDSRMFEENPSEYYEAHTFFGDEPEEDKLDLYANTLKHMNIDKEWIEFKTKKLMELGVGLETQMNKAKQKNNPLSWEKQQQATKDFKLNALTTLEGGADFVEWTGGMVLKKGPDGKYYEIGNQSKKIDVEGMDGYSIASIRAALRK